jgi:outer membrane protein OmpA-like peptidoglycan-associated protein
MKSRIALAVLASLATMPVLAADNHGLHGGFGSASYVEPGFYWGFDLGQSSFGLDQRDLDNQLAAGLGDEGLTVIDSRSETSEDSFTWGITLGYQLLRYLAVEAAYLDLGEAEYKYNALVTDGVTSGDTRSTFNADSSGPAVSLLATLPIGAGWGVYARAGMYFGNNDGSVDTSVDGVPSGSFSDSSTSQSFLWGAGLGYTRGRWTSRLDYQKFTDVGDEDGLGEVDVDRITFSAIYRTDFGFQRGSRATAAAPVAAPVAVAAPAATAAAPVDSDGDGVIDANDRCPNTPAGDRVGPNGCSCDVSVQLQFGFESAELTAADRAALDAVAARLNELEFVGGEVAGHTDSVGDEAYNLDLSKRRAQAVLDYLSMKGVAPGRMTAVGFGESMPIADNATEEGRAQNRRVVIRRTDCGPAG